MIRRARESDIEDILNVLSHYNFKVLKTVDDSLIDEDHKNTLNLYNKVSKIDLKNGFVALNQEKIVGFSHYKHLENDIAKTTLLTVLPEYRRNGFGEKLQIVRMKDAYEKGYKKMITFCETPATVDWYIKRFNYKIIKTEPVCHRLHFIELKNQTIWGVHYGNIKQKYLQVIQCNLEDYFK